MTGPSFVAGVDGCRGGWVVITRTLDDPATARLTLCATFADILALSPSSCMIAIDIPIGLPDAAIAGGRAADVAARMVLGPRRSAVFAVPSRAAVMEPDYRASCRRALATSEPPRMVSKQMFHIFPKIREVDRLMTPALQGRVKEVHPEVAFCALNGWRPLELPKKVGGRPSTPGLAVRRALLATAGYRADLFETALKRSLVGPDDILDAAANSWSAARIARGEARRFPDNPPVDRRGLSCEIWG